jgi:hypothetical protein
MKWFDIVLFMAIVYTFGMILSGYAEQMGMKGVKTFTRPLTAEESAKSTKLLEESKTGAEYTVGSTDPISYALGWFYQQISRAVIFLFNSIPLVDRVFWLPLMMQDAHIPGEIAWGVFTIYAFIMGVAMFEALTGREVER